MDCIITGSSGYLGKLLTGALQKEGHQVTAVGRDLLYGSPEDLASRLSGHDAIVHLAGAPILQRWNDKNKKVILESRTLTTRNLVQAISLLPPDRCPRRVIGSSAIGIYQHGARHDETSHNFDSGFTAEVVKAWEASWSGLPEDTTLTIFRIAVVLGRESATIKKLLIPFRMGIGGKIGHGRQPFPFVHEKDVTRAFLWAIENDQVSGIYNLAAPQEINNTEFTRALARQIKRPAMIPVPPLALKLLYGNAASLLTQSPSVVPKRLPDAGFKFNFPTIETALEEIIGSFTNNSKSATPKSSGRILTDFPTRYPAPISDPLHPQSPPIAGPDHQ